MVISDKCVDSVWGTESWREENIWWWHQQLQLHLPVSFFPPTARCLHLSLSLFLTSFNSEIGNNFSLHVMITAYHVHRVFSIVDKIVMMMETLDNIVTDWIYVTLENIDNCLSWTSLVPPSSLVWCDNILNLTPQSVYWYVKQTRLLLVYA